MPRTDEAQEWVDKFGTCPKGHKLPNRTNRGLCTPVFCAGATTSTGKVGKGGTQKAPRRVGSKGERAMVKATTAELADLGVAEKDSAAEEAERVARKIAAAQGRFAARMAFLKVPTFKDDKEREDWMEAKKKELAPFALADVEYSLKLGDTTEREKARKDILDMTGHGRKEPKEAQPPPLIIFQGAPVLPGQSPWVRRIDKDGKELPVKVIEAPK